MKHKKLHQDLILNGQIKVLIEHSETLILIINVLH